MKTFALRMAILVLTLPACAHDPNRFQVARSLSAAAFTDSTLPAPVPVSDANRKPGIQGPYAEMARKISESTLRSDVLGLLLALKQDESNPEVRVKLGERLLEAGHPELAIAPLRDAFYLRPGRAGIAALLTRAYVGAEKFSEALELSRRMVSERPDESGRWLFLAEVERLAGSEQRSLEAASRALLINPAAYEAKAILGFIYADRGLAPLARRLLTETLDKPGVEVHALEHRLGRLEMDDENWQPALAHFNESLRRKPKMAAALNDRGVVYARTGRWVEARADFAAAIELAPQLAEAQVNHANMKIEEGIRTDASAALAAARREGTDPGAFYIAAGRLYALDASTQTGRADALHYLRRAQDLVPVETRKALERAVAKIQALPPPKPAAVPPTPAPRDAPGPVESNRSTTTPLPAAVSPVRTEPEESTAKPDPNESFRPSVD